MQSRTNFAKTSNVWRRCIEHKRWFFEENWSYHWLTGDPWNLVDILESFFQIRGFKTRLGSSKPGPGKIFNNLHFDSFSYTNECINIESGKGESIVSFAHREGCQLIVIGTRGLDQNQNLRLGKILNLNFIMRLPRCRS